MHVQFCVYLPFHCFNFNTESADETVFEYWHTSPLSAFHLNFQKLIDLNTLIPILCKNRVLCCSDLSMLHKLYQESRTVQVGKLVAILETRGKEGIYKLIESLKEDEEHIGHWELAKILEDKYGMLFEHIMRCFTGFNSHLLLYVSSSTYD